VLRLPSGKRFWSVPRIWPGATVFLIGGGPSVTQSDVDRLQGQRVIAINCAYLVAPWADVFFWCDPKWLDNYGAGLAELPGIKVSGDQHLIGREGVKVVQKDVASGIGRNPHAVTWNANSGGAAINLAYHLGAARIVLLGFDMRRSADGREHFHNIYPRLAQKIDAEGRPLTPKQRKQDPYPGYIKHFTRIAEDLRRLGVECLNATPGSALLAFQFTTLDAILGPSGNHPGGQECPSTNSDSASDP
jgi:hypothetical protein